MFLHCESKIREGVQLSAIDLDHMGAGHTNTSGVDQTTNHSGAADSTNRWHSFAY
jgi:hypothetical protein